VGRSRRHDCRAFVVKHRTRRRRHLFEALKKAGIWVFLVIFVASVVGVALVTIR